MHSMCPLSTLRNYPILHVLQPPFRKQLICMEKAELNSWEWLQDIQLSCRCHPLHYLQHSQQHGQETARNRYLSEVARWDQTRSSPSSRGAWRVVSLEENREYQSDWTLTCYSFGPSPREDQEAVWSPWSPISDVRYPPYRLTPRTTTRQKERWNPKLSTLGHLSGWVEGWWAPHELCWAGKLPVSLQVVGIGQNDGRVRRGHEGGGSLLDAGGGAGNEHGYGWVDGAKCPQGGHFKGDQLQVPSFPQWEWHCRWCR